MSPEKILEVVELYRAFFVARNIGIAPFPHEELLGRERAGLEHCHHMLDKIEQFVQEERMEKAFRWLGFVQGVLWSQRVFTLEELKNHNMPSQEENR